MYSVSHFSDPIWASGRTFLQRGEKCRFQDIAAGAVYIATSGVRVAECITQLHYLHYLHRQFLQHAAYSRIGQTAPGLVMVKCSPARSRARIRSGAASPWRLRNSYPQLGAAPSLDVSRQRKVTMSVFTLDL